MAYTTPRTWVTDETITATLLNTHVRDNIAWAATDAPCCRVYNSANISHTTSGTLQALTFDSERYDTGGCHSTSVNTGRITVPSGAGGKWKIGGHILFASNATGYRQIAIRVNGSTYIASDVRPTASGIDMALSIATEYSASAGDYFELMANQTSGGALNVLTASAYSPEFWAEWVRT